MTVTKAISYQVPARIAPHDAITRVRGHAVILDADLAALYRVPVKRLNEQVRRNVDRFPEDFVFQLTEQEWKGLRSQIATSNGRGGRRYRPYAFTEHGAIMAANVINSAQAIQMSVVVVRAFVKLRRMALSVAGLARKVDELERKSLSENLLGRDGWNSRVGQGVRADAMPGRPCPARRTQPNARRPATHAGAAAAKHAASRRQ